MLGQFRPLDCVVSGKARLCLVKKFRSVRSC
jgi:hypothetical protein